ncbi:MAG: hypothetical protein K2X37_14170 [Chitinophagaceae bacterium]|jgi:hypothetical protein|nr:hypothetical protein [Chitinophagaceae bacterium]
MGSKILFTACIIQCLFLSSACDPERISLDAPPVYTQIVIEPDTDILNIGDTVYLSIEIPTRFLLNNGDSQFIFDGNIDLPFTMKKYDVSIAGSVWSLPTLQDCYTFPVTGFFSKNKYGSGIKGANPILSGGVYVFKMGIIPLKLNTYWIEVTRDGYFHSSKLNTFVYSDFGGINRNHHLIDTIPGMQEWLSSPATNIKTYAFAAQ